MHTQFNIHPKANIVLHLAEHQCAEMQELLVAAGYQNIQVCTDADPQRLPIQDIDLLIVPPPKLPLSHPAPTHCRVLCCIPHPHTRPHLKHHALKHGAHDLLEWPLDPFETWLRVQQQLETLMLTRQLKHQEQHTKLRLQESTQDLHETFESIHKVLQRITHSLHALTGQTQSQTRDIMHRLLQRLDWPEAEIENAIQAAEFKDLGHAFIQPALLAKTAPLGSEERKRMEQHTVRGAQLLVKVKHPLFTTAALMALSHHENWDGSGYPFGLKADQIPLVGRITAVASVFDALSNPRPFREAWPREQTLLHLQNNAGTLFDPELVAWMPEILQELAENP